jgi:hypothetical protein
MQTTFKKQAIYFDQREYNNQLRIFNLDNATRTRVKDFFLKTTGKQLTDFKDITAQLYNHLQETATDNVMNLRIDRYAELKGISYDHIKQAEESIESWIEPDVNNFTCWTNSEKANEKLKDFFELKKAFKKFANKYGINPNAMNLALKNISYYDGTTNDVYPTETFINY